MIKFLIYASMFPVAFFMLISLAAAFGPHRHERSAEMNASDKKVAGLLFVYLVGAFAWAQYAGARDTRIAEAQAVAEKEYNALVAERCRGANRQYEDSLMTRENYGSLSGAQRARMGRELGADGDWVQDQVSKARRALGDCEQGLKAEKATIYQSHGLSLEN